MYDPHLQVARMDAPIFIIRVSEMQVLQPRHDLRVVLFPLLALVEQLQARPDRTQYGITSVSPKSPTSTIRQPAQIGARFTCKYVNFLHPAEQYDHSRWILRKALAHLDFKKNAS